MRPRPVLLYFCLLLLIAARPSSAKTCQIHANAGVTNGNDVGRAAANSVDECEKACVQSAKCCIAEFDANAVRCYLKFGGKLTGGHPGISAIVCTPACAPIPTPPPTPPTPRPPTKPPTPAPPTPAPPTPAPTYPPPPDTLCNLKSGTLLRVVGDFVVLANGFTCAVFDKARPRLATLRGDFDGLGKYGDNSLGANGVELESIDSTTALHSASKNGPAKLNVVSNTSALAAVRFDGITDGIAADCSWQLSLASGSRSLALNTTGRTKSPSSAAPLAATSIRLIRHNFPFAPASVYALFDRGVVQTMAKKSYYASADNLARLYSLGQKNFSASPYGTNTVARNLSISLRRTRVAGSGVSDLVVVGSMTDTPLTNFEEVLWAGQSAGELGSTGGLPLDSWSATGLSTSMPAAPLPATPARWTTAVELAPNNADFPAHGPLGDVSAENSLTHSRDLRAMLTGIYASPVGQLCTHDNAIVRGKRVGQMATTIGAPGYGYCGRGGCSYNFFDPDNYLSTSALLFSGDSYLQQQVRTVLEHSGAYLNKDGALPHHFNGLSPTYASLTGMVQTGPNIFWVLSCLNYAAMSGDLDWLKAYMPTLRNASAFITSKLVPQTGLISAPGSLMIDVFLRSNFTTDTNAVAVGYFRQFANAEEAVGNSTGAETLRALAARIATAVEQKLWAGAAQGGDHFITQLNPDGSTRDLVDYDANFIALAHGIPGSAEKASAVFKRIDGPKGVCPHARGGWVSEDYYGRKDCQRGITGDSWCSMGRISWFDALARKRYGDRQYFDNTILDPLVDDVLRYTWMHERAGCDGSPHTNRTPYYFEFPSVTAMLVHRVRYGISIGLLNVTVSPFLPAPASFKYSVGNVHVDYSSASVNITVPGHGTRNIFIDGLSEGGQYAWKASGSGCSPASGTARALSTGALAFKAPIGGPAGPCRIEVIASH